MTSDNDSRDRSDSPRSPEQPINPTSDKSGFRAIDPQQQPRRRRRARPVEPSKQQSQPDPSWRSSSSEPSQPKPGDRAAQGTASSQTSAASPQSSRRVLPQWRNAPRAERWQKLKSLDQARFQWAQLATFLAVPLLPLGLHVLWFITQFYWYKFARGVLGWGMPVLDYRFPVPGLFQILAGLANEFWGIPNFAWGLSQVLDVLLLASLTFFGAPYFLGFVLQKVYKMQPWSIARLGQISAEAQRRVQGDCQQRDLPVPQFGLLPVSAPIIFTYGSGVKNSRVVLSQGLLDALQEDELAAICSAEVQHLHPLNSGLAAWIVALLQVPYLLYGMVAQLADTVAAWANRQQNRLLELLPLVAVYFLAVVASIAYIIFVALRWMGLWFTRQRSMMADHGATNVTGNPNAYARSLLKVTQAISRDVQQQGQTDYLLEGFELIMPVGYRQAMTLGSMLTQMPIETALAWDWGNSQRNYLTFNNSHALLGGRLARLMQYARDWQLPQELEMQQCMELQQVRKSATTGQLFSAALPVWCAVIGYVVALLLWVLAWIGYFLGLQQVAWLGSDFRLIYGLPLLGFGIGLFMRFNRYFPDLPAPWQRRAPEMPDNLAAIVADPLALPNQAQPTALIGTLMGRRGAANWLCQDLLLDTPRGLVRLHYASPLGWFTNLFWVENRATDLLGQPVTALGWLRRGATPWMDVEFIRNQYGKVRRGGHQVWNTVLALSLIVMGIIWLGALEDLIAIIRRAQGLRA